MKTSKIKFYENKEKRTIVAVTTVYEVSGMSIIPKTLRAKAKCCDTDTYDTEKGKTLATKRLKVKMYDFQKKVYDELRRGFEKEYAKVEEHHNKVIKDLKDYLDTL